MEENDFESRRKIAVKYGWNFSSFKSIVGKFITRKNNEDQWIFDYQSYCYGLSEKHYEHPLKWAKEFYEEDFKTLEYDKFLISLKNSSNEND